MSTNDPLPCPMPGCDEQLILTWESLLSLYRDDVVEADAVDMSAFAPEKAETGTWRVECLAGHVVLLPDPSGCPCPSVDQEGPTCTHDPDDYEWTDEGPHVFRRNDLNRLTALLDRLR